MLKGMTPETAQRRGRALLGLRCVDLRGGLLGKTVVTLELASRKTTNARAAAQARPRRRVLARGRASRANSCVGRGVQGTGHRREIAVDDTGGSLEGTRRWKTGQRDVAGDWFRRWTVGRAPCRRGIRRNVGVGAALVDVMFGNVRRGFTPRGRYTKRSTRAGAFANRRVAHAPGAADVALSTVLGAGKTTAVVEYVTQEVARGSRCCAAPRRTAVDNLVERLMPRGDRLSKLGSGARRKS